MLRHFVRVILCRLSVVVLCVWEGGAGAEGLISGSRLLVSWGNVYSTWN